MLYNKLLELNRSGIYPMHMPGHKRNRGYLPSDFPLGLDITEIHGFDDLHNPKGLLWDTAELAASLYGSNKAFLLINGSTAGILAAIGSFTGRGDKILVTRNCHWSVKNAAELFGLEVLYIEAETDKQTGVPLSADPSAVKNALKQSADIRLVVVTSPSYEGVISDISSIAQIAHKQNIPLFVDSAHGAHLGIVDGFGHSAVKSGADVVVMSLHKTLPAMTQCSLLHACSERADVKRLQHFLSIFQTSSPSYVLLASIDSCLRLLEADSKGLFAVYEKNLSQFGENIKPLKNLSVLWYDKIPGGVFSYDKSKIVICSKDASGKNATQMSGFELMEILRSEYKIELEKACDDYAIAMTSICDSSEGFSRLAEALREIDLKL